MLCQEGPGTMFSCDVKASGCGSASPSGVGCSPCWTVLPYPSISLPQGGAGLVPIFFVGRHGP